MDAISVRLPTNRPADFVDVASLARDMPRAVPLGRWDCDSDGFTPDTKLSTRFAGFMTGDLHESLLFEAARIYPVLGLWASTLLGALIRAICSDVWLPMHCLTAVQAPCQQQVPLA